MQETRKQKTREQEDSEQLAKRQEATGEEARIQKARGQEARAQEAKVQEARVQEPRVQEARVQKTRAQEDSEQLTRRQEATGEEARIQKARGQEARVKEARRQDVEGPAVSAQRREDHHYPPVENNFQDYLDEEDSPYREPGYSPSEWPRDAYPPVVRHASRPAGPPSPERLQTPNRRFSLPPGWPPICKKLECGDFDDKQ